MKVFNTCAKLCIFLVLSIPSAFAVDHAIESVTFDSSTKSNTTPSSVERNKKVARMWFEDVILKKDLSKINTLLANDAVLELSPSYTSSITNSNRMVGIEQIKQQVMEVNKMGDFSGPIIYLIGEGNKVALYRVVTTKLSDGRITEVPWATFFEFDNQGKITKLVHVHDTLLEKQQLEKTANQS